MSALDSIFGQEAAINWLTTAVERDRLPHGLIFAGPTGVGKATTARALASIFLCEKPKGASPCGKCEGCRGMAAGVHPDYHIVERKLIRLEKKEAKASVLAVDVVRTFLNEKANHKSVMNRGKVFVVEEAELMNAQAQNSLLKTLEEPQGRTLIILLTTNANYLLPTVRSRCQQVSFGSLPERLVKEHLQKRGISATDAADAAAITDGSLGVALEWLKNGTIDAARDLAGRLERFSPTSAVELPDWLKKFAESYAAKQLEIDEHGSKDVASREGLVMILTVASNYLRRDMLKTADDPDRLEKLCQAIDAISLTQEYLESNVTISLALEQFASALTAALAA